VSDDYLAELSRRPAAYSPATLGEIWNAEWARSALDTLTGVGRPYQDSYDELVQGIEAAAGSDIATYAAQQKVRLGGGNTRDQNIAALGVLADTLPEERSQPLQPLKDVRKRAADKAHELEKQSADAAAGTYGLTGTATAFLAGVARQALDPVNLATLPLGAGPGMGALRAIGAEALAAAGTQAAQEPLIQAERGRLGLEAGFSQGALNVAQAGVGAAGLTAIFRGAGAVYRHVRGDTPSVRPRESGDPAQEPAFATKRPAGESAAAPPPTPENLRTPTPAPDIPAAARDLAPEDFAAAAAHAERDHVVESQAVDPSPPGVEAHRVRIEETAAALEEGRAIAAQEPGVVAILHEGKLYKGQPGDIHSDLLDRHGIKIEDLTPKSDVDLFVLPSGEVVNRNEMARRGLAESGEDLRDFGLHPTAEQMATPFDKRAPAPTVSAPRKFGPQHQPDETRSLFQFLASRGGLKPDPDLKSILDGNPFVPGFGKLLREGGLSADRAWEAVVEAGYINEPGRHFDIPLQTDHREIYRMVEEEARGNKQYRVGVEPPVSQAEARTRAAQHRAEMEGELDTVLREAGHDPAGFDPSVKKRALQIMQKEGIADPEIAFERAVMENAERFERNARARRQQAEEIPGWDLPADAGTAPRDRRPDRAAGPAGEPAGKPGDGAAGEGASGGGRPDRAAGEATTVIGNPALAKDAERVLAEAGGDFEIHVEQADGSTRRMSAREAIAEAEDDARAAAELTDCIGEEIPF
jgi:hypothetical protein